MYEVLALAGGGGDSGAVVGALIGLGGLLLVQILVVVFAAGILRQVIRDNTRRISTLETRVDQHDAYHAGERDRQLHLATEMVEALRTSRPAGPDQPRPGP